MSKSKSKHLSFNDRNDILEFITKGYSIRKIAKALEYSPSTISRELKNRRVKKKQNKFNNYGTRTCNNLRLTKAPWVCNGCKNYISCHCEKFIYNPKLAHEEYCLILVKSHNKVSCGLEAFEYLNTILTPLIKDKRQSIDHIYATNKEVLGISRSTLYRYIEKGYLEVRNIDLTKRVKYKIKKVKTDKPIIDPKRRYKRTYLDFLAYINKYPELSVYEFDTVIGKNTANEKVLLTLILRNSNFMLAFLRDKNDATSVIDIFNKIESKLGAACFNEIFNVGLTDNGPEFYLVNELEANTRAIPRTKVFYCDARASEQKGKVEKNHVFLRQFLPKGKSLNHLTQDKVNIMMNQINSIKRVALDNKCPFECLTSNQLKALSKLGCQQISANEVNLNPNSIK